MSGDPGGVTGASIIGTWIDGDRVIMHVELVHEEEVDEYERELPGGGAVLAGGGVARMTAKGWLWYCHRCRRNGEIRWMRDLAEDDYDNHLPCEFNPHQWEEWIDGADP